MISEDYVEAIVQAAERDASIARVLREICALDGAVRAGALELVGAHLRTTAAAADASRTSPGSWDTCSCYGS